VRPSRLFLALLATAFFLSATIVGNLSGSRHDAVISFGSICCGPDMEAMLRLDELINRFERRHPGRLRVEKKHWGLEGEVDFCIDFRGLMPGPRDDFASAVKAIINASTHHTVVLKEDSTCRPD
jgi:hypothetical protein